ncbi:hypothetical protein [Pedobacter sp. Hv1]|uniref:hypothetical protein n=1 Tax=Pedobacter sp. Hv1 TaxID=1740090 RepID=UPI0006D8A79A|nr:hypothetical protein [Pedobacter sp. Hv1]KQC02372.1 hypothetical protein AQF98_01985 [Pedobacter sp. Hv1]
MKKLNLKSVLVALIVLCMVACKKDGATNGNVAKTAKEFVALFGPQKQTFTINATTANTLTLKGGTVITIPANAFKIAGAPVTGQVTIEAMEMLKRSDVLFSGTNTNHISGAPLASDGFIFINAKVGNSDVDKTLASPLAIKIPATRTGFTQIWEGVENAGAAANQMAWQAPKINANGAPFEANPINGFYNFNFGTLGWINCDVFYSYTNPKTTVRVEVLNNPGNMATFMAYTGETFVFFCAKGSNVAAQLYTPDGPNKVKSYDNLMPIGVQGKFLSFCIKDGKYYYAELETTVVASQNISLSLIETTEAQVQAAITSLNTY